MKDQILLVCENVIGPGHVLEQREGKVLSVLMHCLANEPIKVVPYTTSITFSMRSVINNSCPTVSVCCSLCTFRL